jgi:hypothetical protein
MWRLVLVALAYACLAASTAAQAANCAPAGSPGAAPPAWQTYCWLDMSTYNNATVFGAHSQEARPMAAA